MPKPKTVSWYLYGPLANSGASIGFKFITAKKGLYDIRAKDGAFVGTVEKYGEGWSILGHRAEIGYHDTRMDATRAMMAQRYGALRHE